MSDFKCLDAKATPTKFALLVGVSQQAISERKNRSALKDGGTLLEWLRQYCNAIREEAAGRSGDDQKNLTQARTEAEIMKSAKLRIEYLREINAVILTEDAAAVLTQWARQSNQDYAQGFHQLVSEIQSKHNIKVDKELVENIVCTTTERIEGYAEKLSRNLIESIDDLSSTEITSDSGSTWRKLSAAVH